MALDIKTRENEEVRNFVKSSLPGREVLPKQQLVAQWREILAIKGAIEKKGTDRHAGKVRQSGNP